MSSRFDASSLAIYDPERAEAYEELGLHTLCPTIESAKRIEKALLEK